MASSIVTSAVKQLGSLLLNEAKNLYEVSDEIECLQHDLRWMRCFLEDADNGQDSEKMVAMWISEIRDFAYEAEEIIEKYVHKVSHPRRNGGWNTIRWLLCALCDAQDLREVGSNIDNLRTRIAELISRLHLYGVQITKETRLAYSFATREQRQTYSHINEDPIGLDEHTKTLVQMLVTNEEVKVVGMCGMGGLGKTTLARQVFQHKTTREHFKNRVWVCISKQFDTRKVFREILQELTTVRDANKKTECDLTKGQLALKICEILNQNTCLVVLDDVWSKDDWDALKPGFDSIKSSPSKILITSRNNGLLRDDEGSLKYSHNLNLLDVEDSWKLFQQIAFLEREITAAESLQLAEIEPDPTEEGTDMKTKEKLGREMLKHCKGLPLAIITLAGVLCNKKSIAEWEAVQKNIASYLMGGLKQSSDTKGLFAILELSYKDLPFYLKPCFMYLGHFPEDYKISAERLYHLWDAEGLVTISSSDGDDIQDMCVDDIAELYLTELVERCLVQVVERRVNGRIKTCRLHDVMRDMCLKKCNEVNFLSIIKHGQISSEEPSRKGVSWSRVDRKLRRCALFLGETKSDDPALVTTPNTAPCIRSLLVFQLGRDCRSRKSSAQNMNKSSLSLLRVLDIESAWDMPLHPKTIKHFIHLRYISFKDSRISIGETLHIWDCKFLETLDLRARVGFEGDFSNKFWKLERLRHLYLPSPMGLEGSKKLFLTDTQLQQMETLRNFSVRVCKMMDLRKMTSLRVFSLKRSEYLSVVEVEHFLKSPVIARKRLVKPLHLRVEANVINNAGTSSLLTAMHSLVCVTGFAIEGRIEALANREIFHKVHLTKLGLSGSEIGQEGISVLEKLPHLKKLAFWNKSFVGNKMSFSDGGFPQLKLLKLHHLEDLKEWEIGEGTLPNLETLDISHCRKLKMIPDGLLKSVVVICYKPCVSGVDKYNICPYHAHAAEAAEEEENSSASFTSNTKRPLSTCVSRPHH